MTSLEISNVLAEVGPRLKRVRTQRDSAGEVAEFDTRVPHWFGAANDRPVEVLSLLGKHAEHIHVRAARRRMDDR